MNAEEATQMNAKGGQESRAVRIPRLASMGTKDLLLFSAFICAPSAFICVSKPFARVTPRPQ
jgi:hypothetical protein